MVHLTNALIVVQMAKMMKFNLKCMTKKRINILTLSAC